MNINCSVLYRLTTLLFACLISFPLSAALPVAGDPGPKPDFCGTITVSCDNGTFLCTGCTDADGNWVYVDCVDKGSSISRVTRDHRHEAIDYSYGSVSSSISSCTSCSTGVSDIGELPRLQFERFRHSRWSGEVGSYGIGGVSNYDIACVGSGGTGSNTNIWFRHPKLMGQPISQLWMVDGKVGIWWAGHRHFREARTYDSLSVLTDNIADIATIIVTDFDGTTYHMETIDTDATARLTSIRDRNNNSISLTYQNPTGFELSTITDAYGKQATIHCNGPLVGGRNLVSSIDLPNSTTINYSYSNGVLTGVAYPDGTNSEFSVTPDARNGERQIQFHDTGSKGTHRRKVLFESEDTYIGEDEQVHSQAQGLIRVLYNGEGERAFESWTNPNNAQKLYYYFGNNKFMRLGREDFYNAKKVHWAREFDPTSTTQTVQDVEFIRQDEYDPDYFQMDLETKDFYKRATGRVPDNIPDSLNSTRQYLSESYSDGTSMTKTVNSFSQTLTYTDRLGRQSANTYDANGNQLTRTVAVGETEESTWSWTYNSKGQPETYTDANGNITNYEYTTEGFLFKVIEPADISGGTRAETEFSYDSSGKLSTITDPEERVTTINYDDRNRVTGIDFFDGSSNSNEYGVAGSNDENLLTATVDRNGNRTEYSFDGHGRITSTVTGAGTPEAVTETCSYLEGTNLKESCVNRGNRTDYNYDYRNRLIGSTSYPNASTTLSNHTALDVLGRQLVSQDPYGRRTFYLYDINDRLARTVTETVPNGTAINTGTNLDGVDYGRVNVDSDSDGYADQAPAGQIYALTKVEQSAAALVRVLSDNAAYLINDYETDSEGQTIETTDGRGNKVTYKYDQQGRMTSSTEAFGSAVAAKTEYDFDDQGNVIEIRYPRFFDAADLEGFNNCKDTFVYTDRNLLKSQTEASGSGVQASMSYTYNLDKTSLDTIDFNGKSWRTLWHRCCGRLLASLSPKLSATGDNRPGNIVNTDFNGNVTHRATVNNIMESNGGAGNSSDPSFHDPLDADTLNESTTRYDALNRPTHSTVWINEISKLGFVQDHARANLIGSGEGGDYGDIIPIAGEDQPAADGLTTRYEYDDDLTDGVGLDLIYSTQIASVGLGVTDSSGSMVQVTNPEGEVSAVIHDAIGRTVLVIDGEGNEVKQVYDTIVSNLLATTTIRDPNGLDITTSSRTDGAGRTLIVIDAEGNASNYFYDANSNLVSYRDANNVGMDCFFDERNRDYSCTDTEGDNTAKTFDDGNNVITITDAKTSSMSYVFDARGRTKTVTDRLPSTTTYLYDDNNNLTSIEDAEGKITEYAYEERNLLIKTTYPDHVDLTNPGDSDYGIVECTFDGANRKTVCTDQLGDTITYEYDMANRLEKRKYRLLGAGVDESEDSFTYDAASRLLTAEKGRYDNICTYEYDESSRMTSETLTINGKNYTSVHEYDDANRETKCTYPDSSVVNKKFTDRDQLESVYFVSLNDIAQYSYDIGMRETVKTLGNGLVSTKVYGRDDNLMTAITVTGKVDLSFTYDYDENKNLIDETRTGVLSGTGFIAGYDSEDRVTSWNRDNFTDTQTWTLTDVGDWDDTTVNGVLEDRTHNDAHELTAIDVSTLSYDSKGNQSTDKDGNTFVWDIDNHLVSVSDSIPSVLGSYEYDAMGRRVSKTVGSTETIFVCKGQQVIAEFDSLDTPYNFDTQTAGDAPLRKYIYGGGYIDEPVLMVTDAGTKYYYHQNRQFNVMGMTDSNGDVVELYAYNTYGEVTYHDDLGVEISASTIGNPYEYTGRRKDSETGLYYFRARYYSDSQGRFISRDPIGTIKK